ncbi:hypothetical protein [Citricoccus sp. GCM10030269]|uniref:hypothetical protein n=1 Tax=Citricoccus sp. GCM10030269 TaxID=3273388 RepID=UPI00360F81BE
MNASDCACRDDLQRLLRWEESGGTWRVKHVRRSSLSVALLTCDGGEEMDVITSSDPRLLAHCQERD